jgi:MtN3 and saliva related transmembrane protein
MTGDATTTMVLGWVAAACTTMSFVPQLVKIRRQGGRDLSDGMLLLYLFGLGLWLAYGIRIRAVEVIGANIVGGALVLAALIMKRCYAPQQDTAVSAPGLTCAGRTSR